MVNSNQVNQTFKQQPGSCVLSCYGIITNYFSPEILVEEVFKGYCDHFGIPYIDYLSAERAYVPHFHLEWQRRHCKGGEVILDLHNTSQAHPYVTSRTVFSGQFLPVTNDDAVLATIKKTLIEKQSFLSLGVRNEDGSTHNILIFGITSGNEQGHTFAVRDPENPGGIHGADDFSNIIKWEIAKDAILFTKL